MNRMYGLDPIQGSNAPWTQEQESMARQFFETRDWIMNESLQVYHACRRKAPAHELQIMQDLMQARMRSMQTQLDALRKTGISERMLFERREQICIGLKNGG